MSVLLLVIHREDLDILILLLYGAVTVNKMKTTIIIRNTFRIHYSQLAVYPGLWFIEMLEKDDVLVYFKMVWIVLFCL